MKYDRIFIFGCSWTNYKWPTWADIIRYSTDTPVENWGLEGIGNVAILHRMVECDLKNKFTDRDLILVQWSTWTREDRYFDKWSQGGCVFNHGFYEKKFVDRYWSWNNDVIKNATAIISANRMFNIGYQYTFYNYPWQPDFGMKADNPNKEMHQFYHKNLPALDCFPNDANTDFGGNCVDGHADIAAHLLFFDNNIKDKFGFELSPASRIKLAVLQDMIAKSLDKKQSREHQFEIIKRLVDQFDPNNQLILGF